MGVSVVEVGRLDDARVAVGRQPVASMLSLVADALGAAPQGVPPAWRRTVRELCAPRAVEALRPAFAPGTFWLPDCLTPSPLDVDGVGAQLDRIRETDADTLYADLTADHPGGLPVGWQRVVDDPRGFMDAYLTLLRTVWERFAPRWHRAQGLLEQETQRIGAAAVTGAMYPVLRALSPRVTFTQTTLALPDPCAKAVALRGRRIVLVPLVSGVSASVLNVDLPDCVWFGYPLPGTGGLRGALAHASAPDRAEAVLGPVRARMLRLARSGPTMGQVSAALHCAPSAVTHHCNHLEAAGLVLRERQGQYVRVWQTETGERLIGLLG
ncbi:winged helix-turn-helix transcriptional regulator [Streptomyces sp. JJ66]|uniref:ArsR/SmtB family transcription factor n=1 Tax=Streptomyces sp. JJ66 TaxID=2803843 RepID=UPI001C599A9C|nr:helix-turn-helix domain-containing protein [Streptomyces sp. JJ66]MBW1600632.1 winged helix-turn-helix transcriptional regulator [Streptomyces sp. JJ66]